MAASIKEVIVVGGPNGAGKTSWAIRNLSSIVNVREFVNADEIARGLSPLNPEGSSLAAGRMMIERLHELAATKEDFAFETTCSGRGHLRFLKACRAEGYRVTLVFLWLPSAAAARARVARRVSQGGHNISDAVIVRRHKLGLHNMRRHYLPLADIAYIYDNSDDAGTLVAEKRLDGELVIHDGMRWNQIEEAVR